MEKRDYPDQILKICITAFITALGFFFLYLNNSYPAEAQRMPRIAAIGTIFLGLVIFVQEVVSVLKMKRESVFGKESIKNNGMMMVVAMVIYIAVLEFVGFIVDTVLFVAVTSYLLGMKSKAEILAFSVVTTLVLYYLFHVLFSISLPQGVLFR